MTASIHFTIGDYAGGKYKVAMSLPELVKQTNEFSTKNQPGCVAKMTSSNPKELFLRYNVTCHLKESDPAGHDVKVKFDLDAITDETKSKDLDVEASCSCPAFLYWGAQWNLHQRDSLEGEPRPLLTAPTERLDLRNHFLICKHVKVVMDRILPSVQHNIVKIVRQRNVDKYKKEHPEPSTAPAPKRKQPEKPRAKDLAVAPPAPEKEVIERDAPATPAERKKVPVLKPQPGTSTPIAEAPAAHAPAPAPKLTPIPTIDDLDTVSEEVEPVTPPPPPQPVKPAPAKSKPTPAKMQKKMTDRDRDFMETLQKDQQKRINRQKQERTKKAPGKRP